MSFFLTQVGLLITINSRQYYDARTNYVRDWAQGKEADSMLIF
jgi:hypothetical protein